MGVSVPSAGEVRVAGMSLADRSGVSTSIAMNKGLTQNATQRRQPSMLGCQRRKGRLTREGEGGMKIHNLVTAYFWR
jgi:hypothetical protein